MTASSTPQEVVELRLVPTAAACWLGLITLLVTGSVGWALGVLSGIGGGCAIVRHYGQALLTGLVGCLVVTAGQVRRLQARAFDPGDAVSGSVAAAPSVTSTGAIHVPVHVAGYPEPLTVFTQDEDALDITAGTPVTVEATYRESDRPGLGEITAEGRIHPLGEPTGPHAFAAHVRRELAYAVDAVFTGEHRGLIPGMAVGDTSLQSPDSEQLYIATGLSHLSAVSGANVAIVCTAALLLCRAVQLGPRVQTGAALGALVVYILLVGTEPSVLRAGVTGVVGLVAVVASSRMQPVHALAIAVIVLLLLQPHLAVAYGFALSVAATFGIVVLTPLLARPLIRAGWPPVLARAVAVAVAADVVTMPIISLMTGEVSVVSVVANILVAPAAAPVTVLGILAALLSLVPGPLAVPVLWLAAPCTGWIHTVASACASLPVVTVKLDPFAVLVGYGWIIAGIICRRLILTGGALAVAAAFLLLPHPLPAQLDPAELETATIATLDAVDEVPAGTQLIVVLDPSGTPAERPTVTRDGVPVLFPNRDGAVTLHVDGSQHAQDGRF